MFKSVNHTYIAIAGVVIAIAALFTSRFVLSVGIGIVVFAAILNPGLKANWRQWVSNPVVVILTSFFLIVLISGLYTENLGAFWAKLRVKLPFLLLPLAMLAAGPFTKRQYLGLLYFFVMIVFGGALWTVVNYGINYAEITESYRVAKVMPTPINHIRFSLMVALATASAVYLYFQKFKLFFTWEPWALLGVGIFLFAFQHLLSVRSGLLALYLVIFFFAVMYTLQTKKYAMGLMALAFMVAMPVASYYLVPTIKNKVDYMKYDLQQYMQGNNKDEYSDARRLRSIEMALKVGNLSPIIGVGYGDVNDVSDKMYDLYYPDTPDDIRVFAHNQFAYIYAALGMLGSIFFLAMIFIPLLYRRGYSNFLISAISIIIISSFLSEHTLEGQYGTIFYLLFLCLGLQYHHNPPTDA